MDTIFMNSKNSKTLEPYRLLLNLTDFLVNIFRFLQAIDVQAIH